MKKTTLHKLGGYALLAFALALLVGPTLMIANMRRPQLVALRLDADVPVALSIQAQ